MITVTAQGEVKKMIEEKLNLCKAAGIKGQISYRLTTGKSVEDEIANLASTGDVDLIVMTSDTISSSIRSFGSTARKVIDNVDVPVMIIHS
jgi:nucleotide-binding universal stress UspA family protein